MTIQELVVALEAAKNNARTISRNALDLFLSDDLRMEEYLRLQRKHLSLVEEARRRLRLEESRQRLQELKSS